MKQRIYADFQKGADDGSLILTCYGTLRDLSRQGIRLENGMSLTFYADSDEAEDMEAEGTAYYVPDGPKRPGHWRARFDWGRLRYVPVDRGTEDQRTHPCFQCRQDLAPYFAAHGRDEAMRCPICGCSIMKPILPPGT